MNKVRLVQPQVWTPYATSMKCKDTRAKSGVRLKHTTATRGVESVLQTIHAFLTQLGKV